MLPRVHDIVGTMRLCKALLLLCAASTDALVPPARLARAPTSTALRADGDQNPKTTNDRKGALVGGLFGGYLLFEFSVGARSEASKADAFELEPAPGGAPAAGATPERPDAR